MQNETHKLKSIIEGLPVTAFPYSNHGFEKVQQFESVRFSVTDNLKNKIEDVAANDAEYLFLIALSAFYILIYKYTSQETMTIECQNKNLCFDHFLFQYAIDKEQSIYEFSLHLKQQITVITNDATQVNYSDFTDNSL